MNGRAESPIRLKPVDTEAFGLLSSDIPAVSNSNNIEAELVAEKQNRNEQKTLYSLLTEESNVANNANTINRPTSSGANSRLQMQQLRTLKNKEKGGELGSNTVLMEEGSISNLASLGQNDSMTSLGSMSKLNGSYSASNLAHAGSDYRPMSGGGGGGVIGAGPRMIRKRSMSGLSAEGFPGRPMNLTTAARTTLEDLKSIRKGLVPPAETLGLDTEEALNRTKNEFTEICEELLSNYGSFQSSLIRLMIWKDNFLDTKLMPISLKMSLVLAVSELFRAKSDLQEPMFTLVRQVKMFSQPWHDKKFAITKLESDYQRLVMALDISIRKLELMKFEKDKLKSNLSLLRWDRISRKLLIKSYSKFFAKWFLIIQIQTRETKAKPRVNIPKSIEEDPVLIDDAEKRRQELSDDEDDDNFRQFIMESRSKSRHNTMDSPLRRPHTSYQDDNIALFDQEMFLQGNEFRGADDELRKQRPVPYVSETSTRFSKVAGPTRLVMYEKHEDAEKTVLQRSNSDRNLPTYLNSSNMEADSDENYLRDRAQGGLAKRSMVRSNSLNAIFQLKDCEWIRPFGMEDPSTKEMFLIDRDEISLSQIQRLEEVSAPIIKPPEEYLKFDNAIVETEENFFDTLDPENTWFSLQDVMELTILHAQQVQILHNSFKSQVETLNAEVDKLKAGVNALEDRNTNLQTDLDRLNAPKQDEEVMTDPVQIRPGSAKNANFSGVNSGNNNSQTSVRPPSAGLLSKKSSNSVPSIVKEEKGIQTSMEFSPASRPITPRKRVNTTGAAIAASEVGTTSLLASRRENLESAKSKATIDDNTFARSFLARLEKFTKEKMRKNELLVREIKQKEKDQLERTIVHKDIAPPIDGSVSELSAEFMPPKSVSPHPRPLSNRIYQQFHRFHPKDDKNNFMTVTDYRRQSHVTEDDQNKSETLTIEERSNFDSESELDENDFMSRNNSSPEYE